MQRDIDMQVGRGPEHSELHGRDIICFSNDWDGDPLSKTHIMRILARDNRVLWVNSLGNRAPQVSARDAGRLWKKLRDVAAGTVEVEPNLHVLGPLALPFFGARARAVNAQVVRTQVKLAMRHLRLHHPISWSFLPSAAPIAGHLGEGVVIYHCVDEFSAFRDAAAQVEDLEADLVRRADLVITSAERLRESKARLNPRTVLVRHGVDHTHFRRALDRATRIPEDISHLPQPVVGFFGLIADWVDLRLVRAVARALPHGSVVLVGKVVSSTAVLADVPNVHLLGRRPYASLPAYCKGWDVALMPFAENELTANANPLKVREYLAAGLPVVSTPVPEVVQLGLCHIASGPRAFAEAVHQALGEDPAQRALRSAAIARDAWEAKVDEIRGHLHALHMQVLAPARKT